MKPDFLWEIFTETGAPEAYLLFRQAGTAQKGSDYVSDDTGARPSDNGIQGN